MTAIEVQAPSTRPWWMENAGCQGKSQLFSSSRREASIARERRENRARKVCF